MKTNQDYKNAALAALKGRWTEAVVLALVVLAISLASTCIPVLSLPVTLLIVLPLNVGVYAVYKNLYYGDGNKMTEKAFNICFNNWSHNVGGMLLMTLYTFLWTLLLIVPGIIKSLSYAMTPFILNDRPELSANDAIELSMNMMEGHKMELFLLWLSFIGWAILAIFTCYIGYLWLMPYMYTALVGFYEDVKAEYEQNTFIN